MPAQVLRIALQVEEALHAGEFPANTALHIGRCSLPGKPDDPLDFPALPGRRAARPPGQEGAGIALVVADGAGRSRIELPTSLRLAVLAEVPFRLFAKVGRLEGRGSTRRHAPRPWVAADLHDGVPKRRREDSVPGGRAGGHYRLVAGCQRGNLCGCAWTEHAAPIPVGDRKLPLLAAGEAPVQLVLELGKPREGPCPDRIIARIDNLVGCQGGLPHRDGED